MFSEKIFPIESLEDYHLYHTCLDDENQLCHEYIEQVLLNKALNNNIC